MKIVAIGQIVELNKLLKEKGFAYQIHLRDACAGQSFYIEQLEEDISEMKKKAFYQILSEYFLNNKMTVVYADDQFNFKIE